MIKTEKAINRLSEKDFTSQIVKGVEITDMSTLGYFTLDGFVCKIGQICAKLVLTQSGV